MSKAHNKTLFLTKEETANVEIRRQKVSDKEYEMNLIKNDLEVYMRTQVLKRLGKDVDSKFHLSPDSKSIEVYEESGLPESTTNS